MKLPYYKVSAKHSGTFCLCQTYEEALKERQSWKDCNYTGTFIKKIKGHTYLSDY